MQRSITKCQSHVLRHLIKEKRLRSQPLYVPLGLELGRITLSCIPKRTRILFRLHYTMLSAPDGVSLVLRLQEGI